MVIILHLQKTLDTHALLYVLETNNVLYNVQCIANVFKSSYIYFMYFVTGLPQQEVETYFKR